MPIVCHKSGDIRQEITFEEQKEYCKIIGCPYGLRCICTNQLHRDKSLNCEKLLFHVLLERGIVEP